MTRASAPPRSATPARGERGSFPAVPTSMALSERAARLAGVEQLTPWLHGQEGTAPVDFFLGSHRPPHLMNSPVPLFVSVRTLDSYVDTGHDRVPTARTVWALDSGGFTELADFGGWRDGEDEYGARITRLIEHFGMPQFVATQDMMCEPIVIGGGTFKGRRFAGCWTARYGFTEAVRIHGELTVENAVYLRENFPHVPWMFTLQGWRIEDYHRCADLYEAAGVDLSAEHVVGLGSVCRRESTGEIEAIARSLHERGIRLHGFGVKTSGLARYGRYLSSADSQAWSAVARRERLRIADDCPHPGDCRNCQTWALVWRERVLARLAGPAGPEQLALDLRSVA